MPISSRMPCVWNTDPGGSSTIWATAIPLPARSAPNIEAINTLRIFFPHSILLLRDSSSHVLIYVASQKMLHCKILMFYLFITQKNGGRALASPAAEVSQWRKQLEPTKRSFQITEAKRRMSWTPSQFCVPKSLFGIQETGNAEIGPKRLAGVTDQLNARSHCANERVMASLFRCESVSQFAQISYDDIAHVESVRCSSALDRLHRPSK
jgi:hypothetical protein